MRFRNRNIGKKRSMRERLLKEGPGAGYTITANGFSDVKITSARVIEADGDGGLVEVNGTCTIDEVYAESYYYGTGKMYDIPAAITQVYINDYDVGYDENISEMSEDELIRLVTGFVKYYGDKIECDYGGGYMHATYDGSIDGRDEPIVLQITNKDVIHFIDIAVSGDNYSEEYRVSTDYNGDIDYFEDEDSAVEYANKLAVDPEYVGDTIYVERWIVYYDFYGDIFDYSEPSIEKVYEVENELEFGDDEDTDYQESVSRKCRTTLSRRKNVNEARIGRTKEDLDFYAEDWKQNGKKVKILDTFITDDNFFLFELGRDFIGVSVNTAISSGGSSFLPVVTISSEDPRLIFDMIRSDAKSKATWWEIGRIAKKADPNYKVNILLGNERYLNRNTWKSESSTTK